MSHFKLRLMALISGLAFAPGMALAVPKDWQLGLQEAATPVQEQIIAFNYWLVVLSIVITLFVLGLLIYVVVKFNAKANPVPSKTTHHALLEVVWTIVPVLILAIIAVPSFKLLYYQRNIPAGDMTIKVIGNPSWNWTYEYPDLGVNEDKSAKVSFTSYLLPKDKAEAQNVPYLLATDTPVVVPVGKVVKLLVTSDPEGIIHGWGMPSFGIKIDAIPGRVNEDWFQVTKPGVYYGQCSELCGKDHAFMPIEVWAVDDAQFKTWSDMLVQQAKPEDVTKFLESIRPKADAVASN